jgi:hypothetical protein
VTQYENTGSETPTVKWSGALQEKDGKILISTELPTPGRIRQAVELRNSEGKVFVGEDGRLPVVDMPNNRRLTAAALTPVVGDLAAARIPDTSGDLQVTSVKQTPEGLLSVYQGQLSPEMEADIAKSGRGKFVHPDQVVPPKEVKWTPVDEVKPGRYTTDTLDPPRTSTLFEIYKDPEGRARMIAHVRGTGGDLFSHDKNSLGTAGGYANGQEDPVQTMLRERKEEYARKRNSPETAGKLAQAEIVLTDASRVGNNPSGDPFDVTAVAFVNGRKGGPAYTEAEVEAMRRMEPTPEVKQVLTPTPAEFVLLGESSRREGTPKTAFDHAARLKDIILDPRFKDEFPDDRRELLENAKDRSPKLAGAFERTLAEPPSIERDRKVIRLLKDEAENGRTLDALDENAGSKAETKAHRAELAAKLKAAGYAPENLLGIPNYGGREDRIMSKQLGDPYASRLSTTVGRTLIAEAITGLDKGEPALSKSDPALLREFDNQTGLESAIGTRTDNLGAPRAGIDGTADNTLRFTSPEGVVDAVAQSNAARSLAARTSFPVEVSSPIKGAPSDVYFPVDGSPDGVLRATKTVTTSPDGRTVTDYSFVGEVTMDQAAAVARRHGLGGSSWEKHQAVERSQDVPVTLTVEGKTLPVIQAEREFGREAARIASIADTADTPALRAAREIPPQPRGYKIISARTVLDSANLPEGINIPVPREEQPGIEHSGLDPFGDRSLEYARRLLRTPGELPANASDGQRQLAEAIERLPATERARLQAQIERARSIKEAAGYIAAISGVIGGALALRRVILDHLEEK